MIGAASADIHIHYDNPKGFIDIEEADSTQAHAVEVMQSHMTAFFHSQQAHSLKPGHTLELTFTDLDRAGYVDRHHNHGFHQVRTLRNVGHVRIAFSYLLKDEQGHLIKQGNENLKKTYTLSAMHVRKGRHDAYYFEKDLLANWLEKLY